MRYQMGQNLDHQTKETETENKINEKTYRLELAHKDILPPKVGILDTVHFANARPVSAEVGHID